MFSEQKYSWEHPMDVSLMRLVWSVIDETPVVVHREGNFSREQIRLILHRIDNQVRLSPQEHVEIRRYLTDRQPLIQAIYLEQCM